jgi:hypothetical protein
MIDCSLVIQPDDAMRSAIRALIGSDPRFDSINYTEHRPLLERPISVNMEVKLTGEDFNNAELQSGIWATAQFSRLEALLADVRTAQNSERQEQQEQLLLLQQAPALMPPTPPALPLAPQVQQRTGDMSLGTAAAVEPATVADPPAAAATPTTAPSDATTLFSMAAAAADAPTFATSSSAPGFLDRYSDAPSMIPFLPLVIIQGHDWHFLAATQNSNGGTVRLH